MRWRSSMPTVSTMKVAQKLRKKIVLGISFCSFTAPVYQR